jgi:hypothetical protein
MPGLPLEVLIVIFVFAIVLFGPRPVSAPAALEAIS